MAVQVLIIPPPPPSPTPTPAILPTLQVFVSIDDTPYNPESAGVLIQNIETLVTSTATNGSSIFPGELLISSMILTGTVDYLLSGVDTGEVSRALRIVHTQCQRAQKSHVPELACTAWLYLCVVSLLDPSPYLSFLQLPPLSSGGSELPTTTSVNSSYLF